MWAEGRKTGERHLYHAFLLSGKSQIRVANSNCSPEDLTVIPCKKLICLYVNINLICCLVCLKNIYSECIKWRSYCPPISSPNLLDIFRTNFIVKI
jgi:hypothetical protein